MIFLVKIVLVTSIIQVLRASSLTSPCPEFFRYDSINQPEEWNGTLTIQSNWELKGVWARFLFDKKPKEFIINGPFEVVTSDNSEILFKNRNITLKPNSPINVKVSVKYDGSKVPSLIAYRLNGRTVCSKSNGESSKLFKNDLSDHDFISSLHIKKLSLSPDCGVPDDGSNDYPWLGAIFAQNDDNKEEFLCEGTLVSPRHILTAAHCVTWRNTETPVNPGILKIYLGRKNANKIGTSSRADVEKIVLYPGYQSSSLLNDLAVIQLDKSVSGSKPICLEDSEGMDKTFLIGYKFSSDKLGEINKSRVKIENCQRFHLDNIRCASYFKDKICTGLSGSPAASSISGKWFLRGIVTIGTAVQNEFTCTQTSEVVLVDLAKYWNWLQSVIS